MEDDETTTDDAKLVFKDSFERMFWQKVYLSATNGGFDDPEGEADVAVETVRLRMWEKA